MMTDDARILGEVIGRLSAMETRMDRLEARVNRLMWGLIGVGGTVVGLWVIDILLKGGS